MIATGAYIRGLREAKKLSRAELGHRVGTHESQIVRIEAGEQDTRGSLLVAIVRAVDGSLEDIGDLMLNDNAGASDGKDAANRRIIQLMQQPDYQRTVDEILDEIDRQEDEKQREIINGLVSWLFGRREKRTPSSGGGSA